MEINPKQNSFLVILLSILLLISLVIAGFFAYQTQQLVNELRVTRDELKQTPTAMPTLDLTTDWKTYTNEKYKFSISMPIDAELDQSNNKFIFRGGENIFVLEITNQLLNYNKLPTCPLENIRNIPCVLSTFDGTKEITKHKIDGHQAISFRYWYGAGEYHIVYQTIETPYIQLEFNGNIYKSELGIAGTKKRDQILSTFKFTN